jgi:hypothetical protein
VVRRICSLAVLVFLASSCGDSTTSNAPTGPSSPTVTSVTVTGTLTIGNIGQTSQLTATAHFAKGTTQDVTTQATWASSDATIAVVSPSGLVTSSGLGTATITATYHDVSGATKVTVTRPPAFTISGLVTESVPTTSTVLAGARIEFTDASNEGRFATTDSSGRYQITQVPAGTYNVRATLSGYVDSTKQVRVTADAIADFALVPTPQTLHHTFTGTISPTSPACYEANPCQVFSLPPVHNTGPLIATLLWNNAGAFLALQLYNADTGQVLASASSTGQANQYLAASIQAPGNYQLRVVGLTVPGNVGITLNVTSYPN